MPKAVMFDCYNTLLRYLSKEDKDGIWEMLLTAISYLTRKGSTVTPEELEEIYLQSCQKVEKKCRNNY